MYLQLSALRGVKLRFRRVSKLVEFELGTLDPSIRHKSLAL